jgi:hypothetical protein
MTTVILKKFPDEWLVPDEDGETIAEHFELGMILDVSTKPDHCRVYVPVDADIPYECLQYIEGDYDKRFLKESFDDLVKRLIK